MKFTESQIKCLTTLCKAQQGQQCFMGGGKRVHVLNSCRSLVRRGLAIEFSNVFFMATDFGREEFSNLAAKNI